MRLNREKVIVLEAEMVGKMVRRMVVDSESYPPDVRAGNKHRSFSMSGVC